MITGYVSINVVADKIYRDLQINTEIPFDSVVEWCAEALLFIGVFSQFDHLLSKVNLVNGKGVLPCGFYKLEDAKYGTKCTTLAGKNFQRTYMTDECFDRLMTRCCDCIGFYIKDNIITVDTPLSEDSIDIQYMGIVVDEDGYPMIPDDIYFITACTAYIIFKLDYSEWRKGILPDKVFNKSESNWDWYCAAARGAGNMPNKAMLDRLYNTIVRLIPNQNKFSNDKERRKIH